MRRFGRLVFALLLLLLMLGIAGCKEESKKPSSSDDECTSFCNDFFSCLSRRAGKSSKLAAKLKQRELGWKTECELGCIAKRAKIQQQFDKYCKKTKKSNSRKP